MSSKNQPGHDKTPARAVCLVSGGMDSAVTLAEAMRDGFEAYALSFDYGQRHVHELHAAKRVAAAVGAIEHRIAKLDLAVFGGSALTADVDVPKDRDEGEIGTGIPITYVPARNTVFLSMALAWAEVLGATDIYIGVNAVDYSGYPDCRPEFLSAFEALACKATAAGTESGARFRIHAPLMKMTKQQVVERAQVLGVDLGLTHTCYDPIGASPEVKACGHCDACLLRLRGFEQAGVPDPIPYATRSHQSS
ncbi:MAG: 7-cyano-7-deazaguanine synthase [Planctomycetota bacterium]|jgi:7-cyano-7-deazaguanine synthase